MIPLAPNAKEPRLPAPFHVMLKPRGPICNLECDYCYFLSKERLYPGSRFHMGNELLETYTRQYMAAQQVPEVTFGWQGGEPLLMGLDFYRRAVAYQEQYKRPGMTVRNSIQTNGTLLDDAWCAFFKEHDFLVGISIDGPQPLHDAYRVDKGGRPTFIRVLAGLRLLQKYDVPFNILCTVHAANADHPLEVYRFFRDELATSFIQFIPIVERDNQSGFQEGDRVTSRSVTAEQYGAFLNAVFDEWVRRDVGRVFVQIFDVALAAWSGQRPGLCIFEETCGQALALEHNGDLYACDHFVEPDYRLGNIDEDLLIDLQTSDRQRQFGQAKQDTLPQYCLECDVRFICNGGCPKNRFTETRGGEPGLNYLCAGYRAFFRHIGPAMRFMAAQLRERRPPALVMAWVREQDRQAVARFEGVGRNELCPCGSGRKFKQCHGHPQYGYQLSRH